MINNSHRKTRNGGEQRSKGGNKTTRHRPARDPRNTAKTDNRQRKAGKRRRKKELLQTISALACDDINGSECGGNGNDGSVVMVGGRGIVKKKRNVPSVNKPSS